jgi:hypothetical protein
MGVVAPPQELVDAVRRLADEVSPVDPETAKARFDVLVADYGPELCRQALMIATADAPPTVDSAARVIKDHRAVVAALKDVWENRNPLWRRAGARSRPLREHPLGVRDPHRNPMWSICRWMPLTSLTPDARPVEIDSGRWVRARTPAPSERGAQSPVIRDDLAATYAWAIPSPGDLDWVTRHLAGRDVVEVGAGTGYWAWQLAQRGVTVHAYDVAPDPRGRFHRVLGGGPQAAAGRHQGAALFLSWPPPDNPMAAQTLRAYTGDTVLVAGEGPGGVCGTAEFFELLANCWARVDTSPHHVTFAGTACELGLYHRL